MLGFRHSHPRIPPVFHLALLGHLAKARRPDETDGSSFPCFLVMLGTGGSLPEILSGAASVGRGGLEIGFKEQNCWHRQLAFAYKESVLKSREPATAEGEHSAPGSRELVSPHSRIHGCQGLWRTPRPERGGEFPRRQHWCSQTFARDFCRASFRACISRWHHWSTAGRQVFCLLARSRSTVETNQSCSHESNEATQPVCSPEEGS